MVTVIYSSFITLKNIDVYFFSPSLLISTLVNFGFPYIVETNLQDHWYLFNKYTSFDIFFPSCTEHWTSDQIFKRLNSNISIICVTLQVRRSSIHFFFFILWVVSLLICYYNFWIQECVVSFISTMNEENVRYIEEVINIFNVLMFWK
jgi:hypothetical protein